MSLAQPMAFPTARPDGYPRLDREPAFDAARHLALETPETVISLDDIGYSEEEIAGCPTRLGASSFFRVLSDEGVACMLEVARALEPYCRGVERISRMVRGGVYQSRFLRDFCLSPEVAEAVSAICEAPMLPHTIPHQLGHLNYNPKTVGENVDKWHVDTLRVDYVMFVTDPNLIEGGEFEYFMGTKHEMAALAAQGAPIPADRVVAPDLPGPGYAVLQQGNMVVHRAKGLRRAGERITLVNGYVPRETGFPDYTRYDQLCIADPAHVATSEYARHVAWMGAQMLQDQIDRAEFRAEKERYADRLDAVAQMLSASARQIREGGDAKEEHFGDG